MLRSMQQRLGSVPPAGPLLISMSRRPSSSCATALTWVVRLEPARDTICDSNTGEGGNRTISALSFNQRLSSSIAPAERQWRAPACSRAGVCMSGFEQGQSANNVVGIGSAEADSIVENLRALRDQIVTAWSERGVVLSREEQAALHSEIQQTCEFLTNLTRHP